MVPHQMGPLFFGNLPYMCGAVKASGPWLMWATVNIQGKPNGRESDTRTLIGPECNLNIESYVPA